MAARYQGLGSLEALGALPHREHWHMNGFLLCRCLAVQARPCGFEQRPPSLSGCALLPRPANGWLLLTVFGTPHGRHQEGDTQEVLP